MKRITGFVDANRKAAPPLVSLSGPKIPWAMSDTEDGPLRQRKQPLEEVK